MKRGKIRKVLKVWLVINLLANIGYADIKVDKNVPQNTSVDRSQNGTNIININTPNSKGISVNDYSEFKTKDPTVFNNFGSGVGRSYLAGMMAANPNLSKEQYARLILNRVNGAERAEIENWLEVMSDKKTDLIFSSNQGFYLNNTGFINFDKVIFTTSKVFLDSNGDIQPFNIRGGSINIGREGINAEGLQYLALLSKQISIDGIISAKDGDLDLIAGDFDYNPHTREYVNRASYNGDMLISASAYGSIYGQQIKVVANGGDLGVKSDMIGYKVLAINADGTVKTNQVQGNSEINIKAKEYIQEGSTYTEGNLNITADKTILAGTGTQAENINITGKLDNQTNIYAKGNIIVGNDTVNTGKLISEKGLTVSGNLNTSNIVYGKDLINISGGLFNSSDIQSEGNITIGLSTTNKGRILTDNILQINGTTINEGTLYGKNKVIVQDLTNNGSVQSTGEITAKNVVNTGKIVGEGNITVLNLDNQNELVTNKALTTNNLTNTGTLNTGEGISSNGNVVNHGVLNTNGSFLILGNLNNYNLLNVRGTLNTRDLINHGSLKAVDSLITRGITFYNQGEVLTTNLDVDNTNIQNTNKITVIETAKLKGNSIVNSGQLSGTNVELQTASLTNSNTIIAEGIINAQNTALNNTGYIGSNQKILLSGSNISNQGSIESNIIELYNLSGYNNIGGSIKGTGVYLTTAGNIDLRGILHGESDLRVNAYDILHTDMITGKGYIELKGHDITNNVELASGSIVIEGTGNVINNSIITGTNGNISGYNIVNNDLIAFGEQAVLRSTDKLTNNAGKAIYGGNLLDIGFNTLENLSGELLSTGVINLNGNYLLNQTGTIQSSNDINMNVTKIDNIGRVDGLNDYEIYYETWDGQILTESEVLSNWQGENYGFVGNLLGTHPGYMVMDDTLQNALYEFWFANKFSEELKALGINNFGEAMLNPVVHSYFEQYTTANGGYIRTDSAEYPLIPLMSKIKSNAVTKYSNISAGNNITITANELNNKDGKISAGNTAELTATTIRNSTTLGDLVQLKNGVEFYKQENYGGAYHIKYWRGIENGDQAYVTGQASVIEARNLIINTGNLELTTGVDTSKQIITGSTTSGGLVSGKAVNTGISNGTGIVNIVKNMTPIGEIIATGVLPIDPLSAQSSLFSTSKDSNSKYLLETRSEYINLKDFYGSDYFLSRLGYDENSDWNMARRLGDSYYEYLLVTRAISDKLGTRFINGLSDKELMKAMLDNSVELQKDLQLSVGVALTPDQVKALKSDVIWYEYEVINGEKILVPKVYLSQATLATIETDGRDRVGGLELTAITADELRNNGQLIGNGGVTYINAGRVYNVTDTNQLSEIRGNQVSITATEGNIENIGGVIRGIESVALTAQNGDIINSSSKVTSSQYTDGRNNTQHENLLSIGEISSEGTTYIEANNYDSKAGILGGSTVILDVKENVTIGALTLSGEDNSGADSDNYVVYRSNQNIGGIVSADNLYVSGKNLNIEGSTVAVSENALLNVEKINIESKVNDIYRESKSKDEGFLSSKESHTKSYEEQNVEGQFFAGGSTVTKADINIIGSTFVTGDDSYLGGNVTATSRELNSSYYHQEKQTGLVSNFDVGAGGISVGAGIQRTEDTININQKTQAMSNVSLGHGTIVDGDKFSLSATNFQHGAIVINSKEVYYGATKNTYDEQREHKESYVGISASISSPLLNRIDQAYNGVEAASKGNGTAGLVNGGVAVINSAVGTINGLAGNQRGANNSFYVSANVGLTASQSESKSHTYYEEGVVTVISGLDENSSITYNNTEKITYEGTQSYGDTFIYNNVKEIEKKAVELNNYYSSSSNNTTVSGGMGSGGWNSVNVSVSGGNSNYTQEGTSYQNGIFVGVNETYNNVGKMTIDGFEQYGGKVTGNIAELDIKSKQNTSKTDGSSSNYSAGTNTQIIGTANGGKGIGHDGISSWTVGGNQTTGDRNYVDTPSGFIIGEGSDLSIGKVTNTGAVIGTEENTNSKLNIDEYIGKNINNKDTYNTTGGTISTGGVGVEYQDKEKEGITHNTVVGNVNIGTSSGDEINRDLNNMQEITKDKDSGYYNTFVESGVLELTTKEGRDKFKESIGLAGQEVDRVIDTMVDSYNTIKNIIVSNKNEEEIFRELDDIPLDKLLQANVIMQSQIDGYENDMVSKYIQRPDVQAQMKQAVTDADLLLSDPNLAKELGINSISDVKNAADDLGILENKTQILEKIPKLLDERKITIDDAKSIAVALYSETADVMLRTQYMGDIKSNIDKEAKFITQQFGERIEKFNDGKLSSPEKEKLVMDINNYLLTKSGITDHNARLVDLNDPLISSFMPLSNINGIVVSEAYEIKNPTPELRNQLTSAGYKVKLIAGTYYVDFSENKEFWNDKNIIHNSSDIVNITGTSGHEIGHILDSILAGKASSTSKNQKITEKDILGRLFNVTRNNWSGGLGDDQSGNYLEYMLRGSELIRKEAGAYLRIELAKELNSKIGGK